MIKLKCISNFFASRHQASIPIAYDKLAFKYWVCALALTGLSLPFSNSAFALSGGCNFWNFSGTDDGILVNSPFSAREVAKITFTHLSGASPNPYTYTYTDNINPANSRSATPGSTIIGDTVTLSIQIPADTTDGKLFIKALGATYALEAVCVAGSPPATSSASTTSAVINAVSRSQARVIQQNIKSRATSVISGANNPNTDTAPRLTSSLRQTAAHRNRQADTAFYDDHRKGTSDQHDALRRIAMMGSFDSSTGMPLLGLGLAGQEDGGGASGIDGRSAFATTAPYTVWGHGAFTSVDNDYVSGGTDSRYHGDVWGYNVGMDYRFSDTLIAGLSLGYNDTDLTTPFNNGSYQEDGWVVSPYAIYRPLPDLTIVAEAGYGIGDIDVKRDDDAVSGTTESDMWYAALTTSYRIRPVETLPLSLTPSLAFIAMGKTVAGYTESDGSNNAAGQSTTRQIKPALEAAYDIAPSKSLVITPFLGAGVIHDFTDEINHDKTAFDIGGGVRLSDSVTGLNAALEGSYLAGRADYTEYTIGGTVTYGFDLTGDDGRSLGIITPFFSSNLNEYGNQRIRAGFGFDIGRLTSSLALSHMMSVANDDDVDRNIGSSKIEISVSLPF